jgi:hypothetical protein
MSVSSKFMHAEAVHRLYDRRSANQLKFGLAGIATAIATKH